MYDNLSNELNPANVAQIVGQNLKQLREQKRMSISEVARLCGIAKATLSKIEKGNSNPTIETLILLANVLGVLPGELLGGNIPRLVRAKDAQYVDGEATHGRLLTRHHNSSVDMHEVVFKKDTEFHSIQTESDALEQLYVIEGKMEVVFPNEKYVLEAGDLVQYPLREGAKLKAIKNDAKVLIIMAYTMRGSQSVSPVFQR